jgi:hypothetical protein
MLGGWVSFAIGAEGTVVAVCSSAILLTSAWPRISGGTVGSHQQGSTER